LSKGLIIFAREPVAGKVKTRLALDIGIKAAADIYTAMLRDTISKASQLEDIRVMIFWAAENDILPALPDLPRVEMFLQRGTNLGQRMENAFETAFNAGISTCCIIGSDSPDLPILFLSQAFHTLETADVDIVYGPAEDGGYYLLGMKRLWSRLFENIRWSTPDVMQITLERIDELQLNGTSLPKWYDIDTLKDLQRLAAAPGVAAPLTREALVKLKTSPNPDDRSI
jgi:rSAM/selenodomain-associated transferase 1